MKTIILISSLFLTASVWAKCGNMDKADMGKMQMQGQMMGGMNQMKEGMERGNMGKMDMKMKKGMKCGNMGKADMGKMQDQMMGGMNQMKESMKGKCGNMDKADK